MKSGKLVAINPVSSILTGASEAVPITNIPLTDDPKSYIQYQEKAVEPEDASWAM